MDIIIDFLISHPLIAVKRIEKECGMYPGTIRLNKRFIPLKHREQLLSILKLYGLNDLHDSVSDITQPLHDGVNEQESNIHDSVNKQENNIHQSVNDSKVNLHNSVSTIDGYIKVSDFMQRAVINRFDNNNTAVSSRSLIGKSFKLIDVTTDPKFS